MYRKRLMSAMILLLYNYVDATCSSTVVTGLDLREPQNTYNPRQAINDIYRTNTWYHTDNASKLVDTEQTFGNCGTIYPVYLKDSHPEFHTITEEETLLETRIALLDGYDAGPSIGIRLCEGKLEYRLPPTPESMSGYCFEPIDASFFALDVNLGDVIVRPEVRHSCGNTSCIPSLDFVCNFTQIQGDGYQYIVDWYHDGTYFMTLGPSSNVFDLDLIEDVLFNNSKGLGTTFLCGVQATFNEARSQMSYSQSYFAGIVMEDHAVTLRKSEEYTLRFRVTIPIGCPYPVSRPTIYIDFYTLSMFERTFACGGTEATIINPQNRCGRDIPCQVPGDNWDPDAVYTMTIIAKTVNTNDPTAYTLDFRMQNRSNGHKILKGYEPDSVTVLVPREEEIFEHKTCYSHMDPHYKTSDGLWFNHHNPGTYDLYQNEKYGIVVQERTLKCNAIATCVCSVAIRAGGDIFIVDMCNGVRFRGFLQCRDGGILQIEEISTWNLRVHTPIGTYININQRFSSYPFLDVDIFMSPKDLNLTRGLCGSNDGYKADDLTGSGGTVYAPNYYPNEFAESWRVTDDTQNMFSTNYVNGNLWADDNENFCFCDHANNSQSNEVTCGGTMYSDLDNCQHTTPPNTQKYCDKVQGSKRKRSLNFVREEHARRMSISFPEKQFREKRQTTANITTDDAFTECNTSIWASPVTTLSGTAFLSANDVNNKVQQCAFDVEVTQNYMFVNIHIEALNGIVKQELEQDPVYVADNTDTVTYYLQNSCEKNCSGNGICDTNGVCACDNIYRGSDCSIDVTAAPVIDYVTNYGLCDVSYQTDCQCYDVVTENLLDGFKCKSQEFVVGVDGTPYPTTEETYNGSYLDVYEGECCFPNSRQELSSVNGGFYTRYSLTISNDGTNYGEPVSIHVYDSTCQQNVTNTTGHISFQLKPDYCFIDGVCVAENQTRINDACNMCMSSAEQYNWTNDCTETTRTSTPLTTVSTRTTTTAATATTTVTTTDDETTTSSTGITYAATTRNENTTSASTAATTTAAATITAAATTTTASTTSITIADTTTAAATTTTASTTSITTADTTTAAATTTAAPMTTTASTTGITTAATTTTAPMATTASTTGITTAATTTATTIGNRASTTAAPGYTTTPAIAGQDNPTNESDDDVNLYIIIAVVLGVVAVIAVITVVVVMKKFGVSSRQVETSMYADNNLEYPSRPPSAAPSLFRSRPFSAS